MDAGDPTGGTGGKPPELSAQAEVLLTLRRLCKQYPGALPSQIMAEDGGLLLQLMQIDNIVNVAEAEELDKSDAIDGEEVYGNGDW